MRMEILSVDVRICSNPKHKPKSKMYKKRNNTYLTYAKNNRSSIGAGNTLVSSIIQKKIEKKSKAGNSYYFIIAQTLNAKPVFVAFGTKKDEQKNQVAFVPPLKRVKVDAPTKVSIKVNEVKTEVKTEVKGTEVKPEVKTDEDTSSSEEEVFEEVPEDENIVKQGGAYGVIIKPYSVIMANSFDRTECANIGPASIVKLALTADLYNDRVSFKASSVTNDGSGINRITFNKYFKDSELSVIPTKDNIDPESFPEGTDPKYYTRSFVLPLSDDSKKFKDVEIVIDPEDASRFSGKKKDDDTVYPCVNTEISADKNQNSMSVVYTDHNDKRFFFKYAYFPEVWQCFGITDVDKWTKAAGRLMFSAVDWFCYGSSNLDNIRSMRANAEDDGCDGMETSGYLDFGESFDDDVVDTSQKSEMQTAEEDGMTATTGFVSTMAVNLAGTAKRAGKELSWAWVVKNYGRDGDYSFMQDLPSSGINSGWRVPLSRGGKLVVNVTELMDGLRDKFFKEAEGKKNLKFYGIFNVGDDTPYEHSDPATFEAFLDEKKMLPAVVYGVIE